MNRTHLESQMLHAVYRGGNYSRLRQKSLWLKKGVTLCCSGPSIQTGSLRKAPAGVSSKGYPPVSRSEFGSPSGIFFLWGWGDRPDWLLCPVKTREFSKLNESLVSISKKLTDCVNPSAENVKRPVVWGHCLRRNFLVVYDPFRSFSD